jgi:hypothetical protein
MKALKIELDMIKECCGLGTSGGFQRLCQVTGVFLARVDSRRPIAEQTTRMLPRLAALVPMEAKLSQNAGDCGRLLLGKLYPHPFANHFSEFKKLRRFAFKQGKQPLGVECSIRFTAGKVNLPRICSAEWFGTALES